MIHDEALKLGAECLAMDIELAQSHSRALDNDVLLVWSDRRGLGSVLVGPDLSVLYFNSSIGPADALEAYRGGRRTPLEKFAVFRGGETRSDLDGS